MKVIKPTTITSGMLVSTTATETYSAWNAATAYSLGDIVLRTATERLYERIVAGTTATAPESDATNWLDIGPSNKWAMFDGNVSTATTRASSLTVVVKPGYANSAAFFGLEGGVIDITVRDALAGTVVYTGSKTLDGAVLLNWFDYFFEPTDQLTEAVFSDLPPYIDAHITTVVTGSTAAIGVMLVGLVYETGITESGVSLDLIDYSVKETDEFGVVTFVRRGNSKRMTVNTYLTNNEINRVQRLIAALTATPCAWIASEQPGFEPLTVFGYCSAFRTEVSSTKSSSNIVIEGLT